ncbi:MAG: hypothetical protein HKO92_09840, partial [Flavobacteriaceae bacterium]|nr:hypothetical protein [Flavobacteriaceae bacterium]
MKILISFISFLMCSISIAQNNNNLWLRNTAISPDGNNIAFTYNADIYSVSSQGGKASRLTTN